MATPIVVNPNKPSDIIVNSGSGSSQVVVKPNPADKIQLNNPKHSGTPIEIDSSIEWGTVVAIATEIARETIYDAVNGDVFGAIDELEDTKQDKVDNSLATKDKSVVGAINEVNKSIESHMEEYETLQQLVSSLETQNDNQEKVITQLQSTNLELNQQLQSLKADNNALQSKIVEMEDLVYAGL